MHIIRNLACLQQYEITAKPFDLFAIYFSFMVLPEKIETGYELKLDV